MKSLFKHIWVVFPIVGIVIYLVMTKMASHEAEFSEDKLIMRRDQYKDELQMTSNKAERKDLLARIKEVEDQLKEAKDRKIAARAADDKNLQEFGDTAKEVSKELEEKEKAKGKGAANDVDELKKLEKANDRDFKKAEGIK